MKLQVMRHWKEQNLKSDTIKDCMRKILQKRMKAERIWLMRTDASGKITFDSEHKVSGDAFLNCQMGKQRFHLGQ